MTITNIIIILSIVIFLIIVIICIWWKFSGKFTCIKPDNDNIKEIELEKINDDSKITVYTLATNMKKQSYNMLSSLKQYKHTYKVINYGDKFEGWRWRVKQYINALENHDNNNIVIFIDAYDAFATKNYEGLYEKFISFDKPIVVSAEKGSPLLVKIYGKVDEWWAENPYYDRDSYEHQCCNAGFVMGYSKDLLIMYKWIYDNNYDDDQAGLREYIKKHPRNIYMDINSEIIYNKIIIGNFNYNVRPYFMHFPGAKNSELIDITMEEHLSKYVDEYYSVYPIYLPHATNVLISLFLIIVLIMIFVCFFYIYK